MKKKSFYIILVLLCTSFVIDRYLFKAPSSRSLASGVQPVNCIKLITKILNDSQQYKANWIADILRSFFRHNSDLNLKPLTYTIQLKNGDIIPFPEITRIGPNTVSAKGQLGTITDTVETLDNYLKITREWDLDLTDLTSSFRLPVEFGFDDFGHIDNWTIPSVVYNGNPIGEGKFPRPSLDIGQSFREDRIPIPSCSIIENDNKFISVFTSPAHDEHHLSSIKLQNQQDPRFQIMIPWEETPKQYNNKGLSIFRANAKGQSTYFENIEGQKFNYKRTFYIAVGDKSDSITKTTQVAWNEIAGAADTAKVDWNSIAFNDFQFLLNNFYYENEKLGIYGLRRGLRQGLIGRQIHEFVEFGFLTKSMEGARAFWKYGEQGKALKMADFLVSLQKDNGLFYTSVKMANGAQGEGFAILPSTDLFSTRTMGESAYQLLLFAKEIESEMPAKANTYRDFAKRFADFFLENPAVASGNSGKFINQSGEIVDFTSTNGEYVSWVMAELYQQTNDKKYYDFAFNSTKYYASQLISKNYQADALDSNAIDKESGAVLLRGINLLYSLSKSPQEKEQILNWGREAADYLLTWTYVYDVPFSSAVPMGKFQIKTQGGTAVSVAHHHLDIYGISIALDFLRLWRATNDTKYLQQANSLMSYASQLMARSDNNFFNRGSKWLGWIPEQQDQTIWTYLPYGFDGVERGSLYNEIGWAQVLTLGSIIDIEKEFPEYFYKLIP